MTKWSSQTEQQREIFTAAKFNAKLHVESQAAHSTLHCSISLLLLCYEVWVIHDRGWDPALWANSHEMGKEDWHWPHQNRCARSYILYFTHFWHKPCNKCDCSIVSPYNVSGWSLFLVMHHKTSMRFTYTELPDSDVFVLKMPGRRAHVCMVLPWIHHQPSRVWPSLGFLLLQYILRRSRNFGLLWIIYWVGLCEDKQRQWSHVYALILRIKWISGTAWEVFGRVTSSFCPLRTSFLFESLDLLWWEDNKEDELSSARPPFQTWETWYPKSGYSPQSHQLISFKDVSLRMWV